MMHRGLSLVTAPALPVVTLPETKNFCRVDDSMIDDDALITGLILAAVNAAETFTGRALITQTWDAKYDSFTCWQLAIPLPKLQSVTSVTYVDTSGNAQTLSASAYVVDTTSYVGNITPVYGTVWPSTRAYPNAVTVRFLAGYGDNPGDVPEPIRQAILQMISHAYDNRESSPVAVTRTAELLMYPYKVFGF